ncbi:Pyrimidine-specific ribonucleoside hydrolase RihA [Bacillus sp. THAF10]|uniref:nucleoside hydrolase n=1 Tax=Bacillus sp. THAF10 TaxID=2587848 RepID=UPI0012681213|nr:nucleoside hydrolase [Bacillus sp. THAF10]QFT88549.1 Pyrimidine-specific ribonucleoside hydrolase RihA [Bacillus sp. THAF10]
MPQKIMLFCDPGIDDSLAIIYSLLNPELELVAVVTSYGNVRQKQATQNVAYLLELANRKGVLLIGGAKTPLSGEFSPFYPEIHGEQGLGPIRPPATIKGELLNFDAIFQVIERYGEDLVIVDVGRATSLAIAFNLGGEELVNRVKGFFLMGGAFLIPGNVTAGAEANFYGDPLAAEVVMATVKNGILYPLNVTNDAIITPEMIEQITSEHNNPYQPLMREIFDYYFKAYQKLVPGIEGGPLHDVMTLFAVTMPQAFKYVEKVVKVGQDQGNLRGVSMADFRPKPDEEGNTLTIALEFDNGAFTENFMEVMTSSLPEYE